MPSFGKDTTGAEVVKIYADYVAGRTVMITGPSQGGIGGQTAIDIAAGKPALLILAGRSLSKIQPVIDEIAATHPTVTTKFVAIDLADNAAVRKAAADVQALAPKLNILINNAGVMALAKYATSADGIEMQFAACHVGHFLLTNLLLPQILAAGPNARIISVSSFGHTVGGVRFDDYNFNDGAAYHAWLSYGQAKTANVLFAQALAARLKGKGVQVFALQPGVIMETNLAGGAALDMMPEAMAMAMENMKGLEPPSTETKSLAAGSSTTLYGALAPELADRSGAFLHNAQVFDSGLVQHVQGKENQEKLWALSEKLVGQKFKY